MRRRMARSLLSDGRCGAPGPELQRLQSRWKILRKSSLWACLSCNTRDGLQHLDGEGASKATEKKRKCLDGQFSSPAGIF